MTNTSFFHQENSSSFPSFQGILDTGKGILRKAVSFIDSFRSVSESTRSRIDSLTPNFSFKDSKTPIIDKSIDLDTFERDLMNFIAEEGANTNASHSVGEVDTNSYQQAKDSSSLEKPYSLLVELNIQSIEKQLQNISFSYGNFGDSLVEFCEQYGGWNTIPAGNRYLSEVIPTVSFIQKSRSYDIFLQELGLSEDDINSFKETSSVKLMRLILELIDSAVEYSNKKCVSSFYNDYNLDVYSNDGIFDSSIRLFIKNCYDAISSLSRGEEHIEIPVFGSYINGNPEFFSIQVGRLGFSHLLDNQNVVIQMENLIGEYRESLRIGEKLIVRKGKLETDKAALTLSQNRIISGESRLQNIKDKQESRQKELRAEGRIILSNCINNSTHLRNTINEIKDSETSLDRTHEFILANKQRLHLMEEESSSINKEIVALDADFQRISNSFVSESSKPTTDSNQELEKLLSQRKSLLARKEYLLGRQLEIIDAENESKAVLFYAEQEIMRFEQIILKLLNKREVLESEQLVLTAEKDKFVSRFTSIDARYQKLDAILAKKDSRKKSISTQLSEVEVLLGDNNRLEAQNTTKVKIIKQQIDTIHDTLKILGGYWLDAMKSYKDTFEPQPQVVQISPKRKRVRGKRKGHGHGENIPLVAAE